MDFISLLIQLVSGAVGGGAAGAAVGKYSLGPALNSIIGFLGGAVGGQLISALTDGSLGAGPGAPLDLTAIVSSIASGGIGGALLTLVIGFIKTKLTAGQP